MDLALCMSLKPRETASLDPEDVAELDGDEVLEALASALSTLGTVKVWDTTSMAPWEIARQERPDLIFNVSEGRRGAAREAQAPALFEWLQWPYVGSDPVTLAITLDKWYTKRVLQAAGIPTPRGQVFCQPIQRSFPDLRFPVIAKPVAEGSGIGILGSGIVESERGLGPAVNSRLEKYVQPVLIEEFLPGREFTVGLIGNSGKWEVLPIVEINFEGIKTGRYPIFGYEEKWVWSTVNELACPAQVSAELHQALNKIAVATCEALRVRDWARVDIRLDENGKPNVLEVNALPGILPGITDISSFTSAAFAAGLDYNNLIHKLVYTALNRYHPEFHGEDRYREVITPPADSAVAG